MSVLKNTGSRSNPWSIGLGICLAMVACSSDSGDGSTTKNNGSSKADDSSDDDDDDSSSSGTKDAGKPGSGGSNGGSKTDSGAPKPMLDAGGSGGTNNQPKADGGSSTTTPSKSDGGGSTTPGGADLGTCTDGSTDPCSVSISPRSKAMIQLGPYGSVMEYNVGKGFENDVALGDSDGGVTCQLFAASFGEDEEETQRVLDTRDLDFALYTVYRPAKPVAGEKYPILSWGNGTCAQPESYGTLLRYVASHGFIVVAPNSRWVGSGTEQRKGIDFIIAASMDSSSPYYGIVDTDKVGVMGHSQGGLSTVNASDDPRVDAAIIFNGGNNASKPFLAISGDMDIGDMQVMAGALAAPKAAYLYFEDIPATGTLSGHLTLMTQPERLMDATVEWWKFLLENDAEAKTWFVGSDCKLCGHDNDSMNKFQYGETGLD